MPASRLPPCQILSQSMLNSDGDASVSKVVVSGEVCLASRSSPSGVRGGWDGGDCGVGNTGLVVRLEDMIKRL